MFNTHIFILFNLDFFLFILDLILLSFFLYKWVNNLFFTVLQYATNKSSYVCWVWKKIYMKIFSFYFLNYVIYVWLYKILKHKSKLSFHFITSIFLFHHLIMLYWKIKRKKFWFFFFLLISEIGCLIELLGILRVFLNT
jgi:hypothetical protein